jgi:alpha-tubulin suppressor-like RCC1 family protein
MWNEGFNKMLTGVKGDKVWITLLIALVFYWLSSITAPVIAHGATLATAREDSKKISAGFDYSMALKADGTIASWGDDFYGQCATDGFSDIVAISAGYYHGLALKADGTVVAWGNNDYGQCQVPDELKDPNALNKVIAISAGNDFSLALKADGTVVAWGNNEYEKCATSHLSDIVDIVAGSSYSLAIKRDGTVVAWGDYESLPPNLTDVVDIDAYDGNNLALKADGTVVAWGSYFNFNQNFGPGNVVAVYAGPYYWLVLKADGTVAHSEDVPSNFDPSQLSDVVALAAGFDHVLVLKSDGAAGAYGNNLYHQCNVPGGLNLTGALSHLQLGTTLTPDFQLDHLDYSIGVSDRAESLEITAYLEFPDHQLIIDGQPATGGEETTVLLTAGKDTIPITVAIPGSGLIRTYNLNLNRVQAASFSVKPLGAKVGEPLKVKVTALNASGQTESGHAGNIPLRWDWDASVAPDGTEPVKPADSSPASFIRGVAIVSGFTLTKAGEEVSITAHDENGATGTSEPIVSQPNVTLTMETIDTIMPASSL